MRISIRQLARTKESHNSSEMVDTKSRVNVKRLSRKALFCCCEEIFVS